MEFLMTKRNIFLINCEYPIGTVMTTNQWFSLLPLNIFMEDIFEEVIVIKRKLKKYKS